MSSSGKLKPYLLCRYAEESSLYTSWIEQLSMGYEVVTECPTDFTPPEDCGIVVTHEHYRWEEVNALRRICESNVVPTLVLADGVLEYRNTWQNPTIPDGSMYQPLFANKIACIGNQSARMIESWGNHGKTEVVGLPRLDSFIGHENPDVDTNSEFRLLICSASTPAFDDDQYASVLESLKVLKQVTDALETIADRKVTVVWRLTAGLDDALGIENNENPIALADEIKSSAAVVTTPSTIVLESMLLGKPTAILDFSNSPQFIQSAWSILASEHVKPVLNELANPPSTKFAVQECFLRDHLQCATPAAPRMVKLVNEMIELGLKRRTENEPVSFPNRLLEPPQDDSNSIQMDYQNLYPDNLVYRQNEEASLQSELNQAIHRLGTTPRELADKNNQIAQLQDALDESRRRVADVRVRLFKLRKILGIGKENQGGP